MPTLSREIESVRVDASASRHSLRSHFSFERILDEVIKARLKKRAFDGDQPKKREADGLLPPRKYWSRPSVRERGGEVCGVRETGCSTRTLEPKVIRRVAIRRRVMKCRKDGTLESQTWGRELVRFVEAIQREVFGRGVKFDEPKMISIVKGYKDGKKVYREVASFEHLKDRVILNLATACVRDVLEGVLKPCCYSFRKDGRITHETAIVALQNWRTRQSGRPMSVAECDIKSFFDNISHQVVRDCWRERIDVDDRAVLDAILEAYLKVYHAKDKPGRGLPQGGSLSVVLANLVLSVADEKVLENSDGQLFYARYCDDVVFAHTDESKCRAVMSAYSAALTKLDLPMHPVADFVYVGARGGGGRSYFEIKSKGPFRWAAAEPGVANVAPWVSFLGSQIRYDGETRIREESIARHIRSLGRVTAEAVREIERKGWLCSAVRGGQATQADMRAAAEWYARFRNRLIAKGVGYVTMKFEDCVACWAGAFGQVTKCRETRVQMRRLDRVRENMLCKVRHLLGGKLGGRHRFKGNPYSYHQFLLREVARVTNLRGRLRPKTLKYSEL